MSRFAAPIAEQIWDMKYRLKAPDGAPVDSAVEESWRRVAKALAAVEAPEARPRWERAFYEALEDFRFLPAGRILAGAGTERAVTLFNCFVMGTVPDSLEGIFDHLREAALTMQQGGGIGYDFSTLRPKGAPVKGVGADASGPLSFMDVWDSMCRTIMSAGARRGAMMATLRCDHPDIEAFVDAKREPGRLRNFNLSVLATDAFMEAVAQDGAWDLVFDGEIVRTIRARDLWDRIMRATYDVAEPGVIFIDRVNGLNNLGYCETISATNPCVTADTWVSTAEGPCQVADLVGRPFTALVDGQPHDSGPEGFFATGVKPVLRLATACGRGLRLTGDHLVRKVHSRTRWRIETGWVAAGDLRPGDEIMLHDHRGADWGAAGEEAAQGYLLGLLIGDGVIREDKTLLSAWPDAACGNGTPAPDAVMARAEALLRTLPHRADFAGWQEVPGRGEWRMGTAALADLARRYGLSRGRKTITPGIERAPAAFGAAVLRGLFDADGSVQGSQSKGVSVRLAQSDVGLLRAAQRMLARLGIIATLYTDRRQIGEAILPDGRGGQSAYPVRAQHELVIAGANLEVFASRIGFEDGAKAARLAAALGTYKRALNRERFVARVAEVTPDGEAPVYDVQVPGVNAFDANGLYVHNCGEQPLPPYGACLLGSINLARLVEAPYEPAARLDEAALARLTAVAVRLMDNVIDASRFPLSQQAEEARAKRRIGLGVTGLADALLMLDLRYGSAEAAAATERWMGAIARAAYRASAKLAQEKGPFPLYDRDAFLARPFVAGLDAETRAEIAEHGIRNALLTSIAPTGTISLYAGNVSSGIEPIFAPAYTRKVTLRDGTRADEEVVDYAVALWRARDEGEDLPPAFVDAQSLAPSEHVRMQAAAQAHVDSSISKTVNVPADIGFEAFKSVYRLAFDTGCKGCTTYRPNAVTGSVLSAGGAAPASGEVVYMAEPLARPETLPGATYKLKWPASAHAIYVTINDIEEGGRRRPFEIFINSKNMEHYAWTVALTRMISAVFRRGGDVSFVVDELKAVFDPRGGAWIGGRHVPSILAAIGGIIEKHMIAIGFLGAGETGALAGPVSGAACEACGSMNVRMIEGCATCADCGFSKCA